MPSFENTSAGALWLISPPRRSLFKLVPTSPAPAPSSVSPPPRAPRPLVNGPLGPGRWKSSKFEVPFAITVGTSGWIGDVSADSVFIGRTDDRTVTLSIDAPRQIFTSTGDLAPLRGPRQVVDAVQRLPHVRTESERTTTVGGVRARAITARARPHRDYPTDLCRGPCVPLYSLPAAIATAMIQEEPLDIVALRHRGRFVVLLKEHDDRTETLVRSIRFR